MDFFDLNKNFDVIHLGGGETEGYKNPNPYYDDEFDDKSVASSRFAERGQDYTQKYKAREELEYLESYKRREAMASSSGMNNLEELTSLGSLRDPGELENNEKAALNEHYKLNLKKDLKIYEMKRKIQQMVNSHPVSVLTGPTGCGKTTQVPQYILESCWEKNQYCNIVVTQPRRIAAMSIAQRVCDEQGWELGSICGYKVGLKTNVSEDTRLTYVTCGVLLNSLISKKTLSDYTHIVLDEVHERDEDMDFTLLVVKKLWLLNSKNIKIILMSATMDCHQFASYFPTYAGGLPESASVLQLVKKTNYSVQVHYLDELQTLGTPPDFHLDMPCIADENIQICIKLLKQLDRIDLDVKNKKSVLVFLPGMLHIDQLYGLLTDPKIYSPTNTLSYRWHVLPLHSNITSAEQVSVFKAAPPGHRKIILSTNIAESSITVPDVKFVIDFCLTKLLKTDTRTNFTTLEMSWASKSNCVQRAGRVGRVMEGKVYRMIPKQLYEELDDECLPEVLRAPLDRLILQTKLLNLGPPDMMLAAMLNAPDLCNIKQTILSLKEMGAMLMTCNGRMNSVDGDITYLGRLMAKMPVDVHITKLMVLGHVFSCLSDCIIIAAALSVKNLFSNPFREVVTAYVKKLIWADGSCSDCFAFLNVFKSWRNQVDAGVFRQSAFKSMREWAERNYVQPSRLHEVSLLVDLLTQRLRDNFIEEDQGTSKVCWTVSQRALVVKIVVAGAFYPNYFGRGEMGGQVNEEAAVKMLGGRNPYNTVYLTNYPSDQPRDIYSKSIRESLLRMTRRDNLDMRIDYDATNKVYIEFRESDSPSHPDFPYDSKIPGQIVMPVYWTLKAKQGRASIEIPMLPPMEARKWAEGLGVGKRHVTLEEESKEEVQRQTTLFPTQLPSVLVEFIQIEIAKVNDPEDFWVHHADEDHKRQRSHIDWLLNMAKQELETMEVSPALGSYCMAQYVAVPGAPGRWCRARVEKIDFRTSKEQNVLVFFCDHGDFREMKLSQLKYLPPNVFSEVSRIPQQAFKCALKGVKPTWLLNFSGTWTQAAKDHFHHIVHSATELYGSVYSVVSDVVRLRLIAGQLDLGEHLIDQGYAESAEESLISQENNNMRLKAQSEGLNVEFYDSLQRSDQWHTTDWLEPPDRTACTKTVVLKGPFSPLETRVFSYVRGGLNKEVKIGNESVNSVFLDADPKDIQERMMVAAHVSENTKTSMLTLHGTTVMPKIAGLPALLTLMFAPSVEIRLNMEETRYTGLICGLGCDSRGKSLYPEHDMEVVFDCEINQNDLIQVNQLRQCISDILRIDPEDEAPRCSYANIIKAQQRIKDTLLGLVKKPRAPQVLGFPEIGLKWGMVNQRRLLTANVGDKTDMLQCHQLVKTKTDHTKLERQRAAIKRMHTMLNRTENFQPVDCPVCQVNTLTTINLLRIHVNSDQHKRREADLLTDS